MERAAAARVGRKARLAGTVETVDFVPPALPNGRDTPQERHLTRRPGADFKGYDIYHVEQEWRDWSAGKEPPRNADAAFLAFFAKYVERHPL